MNHEQRLKRAYLDEKKIDRIARANQITPTDLANRAIELSGKATKNWKADQYGDYIFNEASLRIFTVDSHSAIEESELDNATIAVFSRNNIEAMGRIILVYEEALAYAHGPLIPYKADEARAKAAEICQEARGE